MKILEPAQSRAARGLLNWTQAELAKKSGLSLPTLRRFENGAHTPIPNNIAAIRRAFETAGVEFLVDTKAAEVGVILKATNTTNSLVKKRTIEKCAMLVGGIIQSFSTIEVLLKEFCVRCRRIEAYKEITGRHPDTFEAHTKLVKAIISHSSQLAAYSEPTKNLIDETIRLYELRKFLAHGIFSLSTRDGYTISYKLYHEQETKIDTEEFKTNIEHLETSVALIDRCAKSLTQLFAKISKDQNLGRA